MIDYYLDQPKEVSLETWAYCNAKCVFCPYPTMDRQGEKMSDDLISKLVDQMIDFEHGFYFCPFKVNEPLLDKRTLPLCETMIASANCGIRFFTNGAVLTIKSIDRLARMPVGRVAQVSVSLNSHKPDDYHNLMSLDFNRTAKKLDMLHDSEFPHPVWLTTVGYPNDEFVRYCKDRWPDFEPFVIKQSGWLGEIEAQDWDVPDEPCGRWWELSIMSSGKVALCCMDGTGAYSIGDSNKDTLLDIYAKTRPLRVNQSRDAAPCSTCTY